MSQSELTSSHKRITIAKEDATKQAREVAQIICNHLSNSDLQGAENLVVILQQHISKAQANQNMLFGIELATHELKGSE